MNLKTDTKKSTQIIGEFCFWLAFVIELLIVIVDKSAYINPYESWLFRITFVLFCIKILTTKYSKDEWIVILISGAIASATYFLTERDEVVRAAVFVISCKNVDLKKMLRVILWITVSGAVVLFLLSATGIFGLFAVTADFGRGAVETRYCFGMGHPNSFSSMLFMMSTIAVYLYVSERYDVPVRDKRLYIQLTMMVIAVCGVNIICFLFTDSNTSMIVMTTFTAGVLLMLWSERLRRSNFPYIAGAVIFIMIVLFSMYGAKVGNETAFMYRLDKLLNGRFQYSYIYEAARLENWRLFANPENQEYFDQGFIRLFYWYGILPGIAYLGANLFLIRQSCQKRDLVLLVIVVAYSVFTIMEAHLISVYLLRNYLLVWLGYYWYQPFLDRERSL
ncbi:MAG: hypothetical protein K2M91_01955 [Lachnospiraceae bacterium]|nr:hypothetical protein [Lachnospiraceae bacterium]